MESANVLKIQRLCCLLAANYTWDNPFQTISKGSVVASWLFLLLALSLTFRQPIVCNNQV